MKLWSLLGNSQKLDGGAMFGNAPRAMWAQWLPPDEGNRVPLACRALLASPLNGKTVLFETGIGAFFEPKMRERYGVVEPQHVLLESLAKAGFSHEDIDVVVLSHLHFDHAGGLLAPWSEGQPARLLFPKARFITVSTSATRRAPVSTASASLPVLPLCVWKTISRRLRSLMRALREVSSGAAAGSRGDWLSGGRIQAV